jgi:hypothetical protein
LGQIEVLLYLVAEAETVRRISHPGCEIRSGLLAAHA